MNYIHYNNDPKIIWTPTSLTIDPIIFSTRSSSLHKMFVKKISNSSFCECRYFVISQRHTWILPFNEHVPWEELRCKLLVEERSIFKTLLCLHIIGTSRSSLRVEKHIRRSPEDTTKKFLKNLDINIMVVLSWPPHVQYISLILDKQKFSIYNITSAQC